MGIGYGQSIRVLKKYREKGDEALNHGKIGKRSGNQKDDAFKLKIIEKYKERYSDFGPTFASEKFFEEFGIEINRETLRLWLIKEVYGQRDGKRQNTGAKDPERNVSER